MTRGRRPDWERAVAGLDGSALAKARLTAILAVVSGRQAVATAALELGLSERRLHRLRLQMLQAALVGLEPHPAGRPAYRAAPTAGDADALRAQVAQLRLELHAAQVRQDIALVMPQLLVRGGKPKKTGRAQTRARNRPRPCGGRGACKC